MVEISKKDMKLLLKGPWSAKFLIEDLGNTTLNTEILF